MILRLLKMVLRLFCSISNIENSHLHLNNFENVSWLQKFVKIIMKDGLRRGNVFGMTALDKYSTKASLFL